MEGVLSVVSFTFQKLCFIFTIMSIGSLVINLRYASTYFKIILREEMTLLEEQQETMNISEVYLKSIPTQSLSHKIDPNKTVSLNQLIVQQPGFNSPQHSLRSKNTIPNSPGRSDVHVRILKPINVHPLESIDPYYIAPLPADNASGSSLGIYFSVKTTMNNHNTRLPTLILTWMQTVQPAQVHIVTDILNPADDKWIDVARKHGFHLKTTSCPIGHRPWYLCCKSGHEYDGYYRAKELGEKYKWFCHFDDDVYVNVPMLTATLDKYDPLKDKVYIGRWSGEDYRKSTMKISTLSNFSSSYHQFDYRFASGAGYCISDSLMHELERYLRGSLFDETCEKLKKTDDMSVGAIVEAVLGYQLRNNQYFNSHFNHQAYSPTELRNQISISYSLKGRRNVITLPNATFDSEKDSTRFFSFHCFLYPQTKWCKL